MPEVSGRRQRQRFDSLSRAIRRGRDSDSTRVRARGPEEIAKSEQKDHDVAKWSIQSRPVDALRIHDNWIYGVAHVDATIVAHADGRTKSFKATKTWLLHKEPAGEWLIKRQMWNLK